MGNPSAKTVAVLAVPGVQLLDVCGPLDVFAEANVQAGKEVYRLAVIATKRGPLRSSSGVCLTPDRAIGDDTTDDIHTLLVAGSPNAVNTRLGSPSVEWLRERAKRARRFGSVCSGAFFLAESGLLDRRRVTTHWSVARELAERYPNITVEEDALYVRDGCVRTAAGVTAGLDLALALVEEDLGREIAMNISCQLVMFFKRPGGQMQFSRQGGVAIGGRSALQEVQRWVSANLDIDHSVPSMAKRLELSPRHFARIFHAEMGMTPGAWVEAARIASARRLLEDGQLAPKEVAGRCGYSSVDILRLAFVRLVGVTPAEYRKRSASPSEAV